MARSLRANFKNGWYHVTARGNNRQRIFFDEPDRRHFLELVGQMIERQRVQVHAYVLMDNHYHLVVRTPEANLSAAVQWLNVAYSIWWNRRHGRTGHVFEGRFKAVVIESGEWVLACSLYLHLNPVAVTGLGLSKREKLAESRGERRAPAAVLAKRLERLRNYPWSSFGAYAGYGAGPAWLSREEVLARAGGPKGYRKLAEEKVGRGLEESLWSQLRWGLVLGGERFARKVQEGLKVGRESTGRRAARGRKAWGEVVRAVEKARGEKWKAFARRRGDPGLALTLYVGRRCTGLTLRELGEAAGGMDYNAVGMAISRLERRLSKDSPLRRMAERILSEMA